MSGRIRSIKPELLDDEPTAGLSDAAWRLFVSLWVVADDHGNVRLGSKYVAATVWQDTSRDVDSYITELVEKRFLVPYAKGEQRYAFIRGWDKHQRVDNKGKGRVPSPNEDDGSLPTWFREFRTISCANSETRIRDARELGNEDPESPLARRPRAQSGGQTTISITDPDHDHDPEARAVGSDAGDTKAPTMPQDRSGHPAATIPIPKNVAALEREFWLAAYASAVKRATGSKSFVLDRKTYGTLDDVVSEFCPDRKRITPWLDREVERFVRDVAGENPRLWSNYGPSGFLRWLNERSASAGAPPTIVLDAPPPRAADDAPLSTAETARLAKAALATIDQRGAAHG